MFKVLMSLTILLMLFGCGNHTKIKDNPRPSNLPFEFDFAVIKRDILDPYKCTDCHKQYNNYKTVRKMAPKILSSVLENRMPKKGPLVSTDLRSVLKTWVNDGAPEFKNSQGDFEEEVLEPSWVSIYDNVISIKCLDCHNPVRLEGDLDFSTLETFKDTENRLIFTPAPFLDTEDPEGSYLISVLTDPKLLMPPPKSNIDAVTPEEISVIIEWIGFDLPEK